eukprot:TRINITY_DN519_c0_g1_i3.p5 TRINITY_DN519_c0_g1~~TRINITY_DN519_c0_g1_i3.p5  ORF type:complete len:171 (+),score=35.87 TRINITY_DN519_c0_g1_i3:821-1333(+)
MSLTMLQALYVCLALISFNMNTIKCEQICDVSCENLEDSVEQSLEDEVGHGMVVPIDEEFEMGKLVLPPTPKAEDLQEVADLEEEEEDEEEKPELGTWGVLPASEPLMELLEELEQTLKQPIDFTPIDFIQLADIKKGERLQIPNFGLQLMLHTNLCFAVISIIYFFIAI